MRTRIITVLALSLLAGVATSVRAQNGTRSNTSKFFLAFELNGSSITLEDDDEQSESGGGATLRLGYGFTRVVSMFAELAGAAISANGQNWTLAHADLGVRVHLGSAAGALRPYVEGAFTARSGMRDDFEFDPGTGPPQRGEFEISGGGFTVGGGLLYFFGPNVALSTGLKWTTGEFSTVRFNNVSVSGFEIDATSVRFNVGLSWFPMSK
jgi:hypothetical protein